VVSECSGKILGRTLCRKSNRRHTYFAIADSWISRFICSSNNNITRITKMVTSLCKHYSPCLLSLPPPCLSGEHAEGQEAESYHPFPPPSVLAAPEVGSILRTLGFGYRAEFIQRTAAMLVDTHGTGVTRDKRETSEKWLMTLRNVNTSDAREELLKFIGVGRKVADCILLMSLDKVGSDEDCTFLQAANSKTFAERSYTRRYSCLSNCHQALRTSCLIWH